MGMDNENDQKEKQLRADLDEILAREECYWRQKLREI